MTRRYLLGLDFRWRDTCPTHGLHKSDKIGGKTGGAGRGEQESARDGARELTRACAVLAKAGQSKQARGKYSGDGKKDSRAIDAGTWLTLPACIACIGLGKPGTLSSRGHRRLVRREDCA